MKEKVIYTINTVYNAYELIIDPFGKPFLERNPDIKVYNILDDSLLPETREVGSVTPNVCNRMLNYAKAAELSGAGGVLVTCTSVIEGTLYIKERVGIPVINIAEPVAEMAVENGTKIGVMGTIPTSPGAIDFLINRRAKEINKKIEIVDVVVDGAFDVLCAGNREKHDEMVCEALYKLAREVDVIAFAQISMSLLKHNPVDVPVYKIGDSGYDKIKDLIK
ncbi:MAG: aspartate/glutamate racemase family protein [Acetivibrionales bacterium]|jgi:Asp/Glu/hydantoin racemase